MSKEYTFTTKHYPANDLWELDLQSHLDQMAADGWALVCTQHLIHEARQTTPQMIIFWSKGQTFQVTRPLMGKGRGFTSSAETEKKQTVIPALDIISNERSFKMEIDIVMWTVICIVVGIVLILVITKVFRK